MQVKSASMVDCSALTLTAVESLDRSSFLSLKG